MLVKTEFDYSIIKKMEEAGKKYGQKCVERAQRDAMKKGKATLSKEVRDRYNVKKRDFDSYVKTKPGMIVTESSSLTPGSDTHFSITPRAYASQKGIPVKRRKKVTVTIKKGARKKVVHAFIMNPQAIQYGHTILFEHGNAKRGGREIIKSIKSVSAAQMASNAEVSQKTMNAMKETLSSRLDHYVEREMEKIANN